LVLAILCNGGLENLVLGVLEWVRMRWAEKGADYLPYTYYIKNNKNTMKGEEKQKDLPPLIMILTMVDEKEGRCT
jgi:hypothetical protein